MNREKRLIVLVFVLIVLLGYLFFGSGLYYRGEDSQAGQQPSTISANNSINAVRLVRTEQFFSYLEVDYLYNGQSGPNATMVVEVDPEKLRPGDRDAVRGGGIVSTAGQRKQTIRIVRPQEHGKHQTRTVRLTLKNSSGVVLTQRSFDLPIDWPSTDPFALQSNTPEEIDRVYKLCVEKIDRIIDMESAKRGLENILLANPEYVPAYAELARYHMKSNWSREGLQQAERALDSALRINPSHANSLVLMGYVYANQKRFAEAETALRKAETIGTGNIWLHANWGDLRRLQKRPREAAEYYRKAIVAPEDQKTYERARNYAYMQLIGLLTDDKKWDEVNALYVQRIQKYPDNGCYKLDHARFMLNHAGKPDEAISIATPALEQGCNIDERNDPKRFMDPKQVLAVAYYTKWALAQQTPEGRKSSEQYYVRGQALYSNTVPLVYLLALSEKTAIAIPALKTRGIKVDATDGEGHTALGYAVMNSDSKTASQLIKYGANVNATFNEDGLTLLMLAVANNDRELAELLLKHGADKRRKTVSGYTAEKIASARGFKAMADLLGSRKGI